MRRLISLLAAIAICVALLPNTFGSVSATGVTMNGTGTSSDPYQITTAAQLEEFRDLVNAGQTSIHAVLMNDITFNEGMTFSWDPSTYDPLVNGGAVPSTVKQWIPIGKPTSTAMSAEALVEGWYTGTFDGQGHTISGLYCNYQTDVLLQGMSAAGLFCALGNGSEVKNVHIKNSYFRGDGAAGIAAGCQGSINACFVDSDVYVRGYPMSGSGSAYAGGIACIIIYADASVGRCVSLGSVSGPEGCVGGIVASNGLSVMGITIPGTAVSNFTYNYYLNTVSGVEIKNCTAVSQTRFATGEITYRLNKAGSNGQQYYQTLGEALYPSFEGAEVYQVKGCDGRSRAYSNTDEPLDHVFNANGVCTSGCEETAAMAYEVDGVKTFTFDAAEAIAAAAGKTAILTLYQNVVLDDTFAVSAGSSITLNLNGFELGVQNGSAAIRVDSGAQLTIEDSSADSTGAVTAANASALEAASGSSLEIKAGMFSGGSGYAVKLAGSGAVISGGQFAGISSETALSGVLTDGKTLRYIDGQTIARDQLSNAYTENMEVVPDSSTAPSNPTIPSNPGDETDPTVPDGTDPTTPTKPNDPAAPELETDPVIQMPVISEIPSACEQEQYLCLDLNPLTGMTLNELTGKMSFEGLEDQDYRVTIEGNDGTKKVKTSDRLVVKVYGTSGQVVATRTFVLAVMGDTNCDGRSMSNDAAMMARIAEGMAQVSDEVFLAADMDGSKSIAANDSLTIIYKYYHWNEDYVSALQ